MKTPLRIWRLVFVCGMFLLVISDLQGSAFGRARFLLSMVMFGGMIYLNCIIQEGVVQIHSPNTSRQKCREAYEKMREWLRSQNNAIHWKDAPVSAFKDAFEQHLHDYPEERSAEEVKRWKTLYDWLAAEVGPRTKALPE